MNQVRITLHVMADSRGDAFTLARAAIECLYEGGSGCASGPTGYGTYRADIETITVPYDDETEPPDQGKPLHRGFVPSQCPGCKGECDRHGECTNTGCAFGPDDESDPAFGAHIPHPVTAAEAEA